MTDRIVAWAFALLGSSVIASIAACGGDSEKATDSDAGAGGGSDGGAGGEVDGGSDSGPLGSSSFCSGPNDEWCWENPLPQGTDIVDTHAAASDRVWMINAGGEIIFWNGTELRHISIPLAEFDLERTTTIREAPSGELWIGGQGPAILRGDGEHWDAISLPTGGAYIQDLAVSESTGTFAAGGGEIFRCQDTGCEVVTPDDEYNLPSVWASEGEVWVAGGPGSLYRWDGSAFAAVEPRPSSPVVFHVRGSPTGDVWIWTAYQAWRKVSSGWDEVPFLFERQTDELVDSFGFASDDFRLVGSRFENPAYVGSVYHATPDGLELEATLPAPLLGVSASAPDRAWAGGERGLIAAYDGSDWSVVGGMGFTQTIRDLWADPNGTVWAVGDDGLVATFDGTTWQTRDIGVTDTLYGVWGTGPDDMWIVGAEDLILRDTGDGFEEVSPPSYRLIDYYSVHGAEGKVFITGGLLADAEKGIILVWDGESFSEEWTDSGTAMMGVSALSATEAWIVGVTPSTGSRIVHYQAGEWTVDQTGWPLVDVWAAGPDDVYAVGGNLNRASIVHWDGTSWETAEDPGRLYAEHSMYYAITGTAADDVWAVSLGGQNVAHFDGSKWSEFKVRAAETAFYGIAARARGDVHLGGKAGAILHRSP